MRRTVGTDVEFLAPDDSAFGPVGGADFVGFDGTDRDGSFGDEPPRSRWMPVLAGVVIVGLLGAGVVAAAPWRGDTSRPTPSATSTVPTSSSTVASTELDQRSNGLVIDDAGPFVLAGVYEQDRDPRSPGTYGNSHFDLLATPGATRSSGRWLSVLTRQVQSGLAQPDGMRLSLNGQPALLVIGDDGVAALDFAAVDGSLFRVSGHGFDLADLTQITAQLTTGDGPIVEYGTLRRGLLADMTPLLSRTLDHADLSSLLPARLSSSAYASGVDRQSIVVGLIPMSTDDDHILDLLGRPVTDMYRRNQAVLSRMGRDGKPVTLRADPDAPNSLIASWPASGGRVTVWSFGIAAADLIDLLPNVRVTTDGEWDELLAGTSRGEFTNPGVRRPSRVALPTTVGEFQGGESSIDWSIVMATDPFSISLNANTRTMGTGWVGDMGDVPATPTLHRWASSTVTFLVATTGWKTPVRQIRVTIDGRDPVVLPMVEVGESGTFAAGFAFADPTGGTLEFLDGTGAVVSTQRFAA